MRMHMSSLKIKEGLSKLIDSSDMCMEVRVCTMVKPSSEFMKVKKLEYF